MRDEETLMLLALVAMLGRRRVEVDWGTGWMWPVPTMRVGGINYDAVISDGFGSPRPGMIDGLHGGVDVMYRRRTRSDLVQAYKPGTHDGTAMFFAPPRTPIVAAHDGTLWSCLKTDRGYAAVVSHTGTPFATFYQHMETPAVPLAAHNRVLTTGQPYQVKAGDVLGFMGYDPLDGAKLRHLHFAVWFKGPANNAIDPEDAMRTWQRPPFVFQP